MNGDEYRPHIGEDDHVPLVPLGQKPKPARGLGIPAAKAKWNTLDLLAACFSTICAAIGIAAVASERFSWKLGVVNQLIVVGFLLSIMNSCLARVVPTIFLLLEARLGRSTLQNYDTILRNQLFARQADFVWRLSIGMLLILPLGLSAGYKRFTGGQSSQPVDIASVTGYQPYYGLYAVPGLQPLGTDIGLAIFFNATMPFLSEAVVPNNPPTRDKWNIYKNPTYRPLPNFPRAYGYNILALGQNRTAILDIPHSDYVSAMQSKLTDNEAWAIQAKVRATVTYRNDSIDQHRDTLNSTFWQKYASDDYFISSLGLFTGYVVQLFESNSTDESQVILAVYSDGGTASLTSPGVYNEKNFLQTARMYNIHREECDGIWTVSRGNMELESGNCSNVPLPSDQQLFEDSGFLALGNWYMPALGEIIGRFGISMADPGAARPSYWQDTVMTTTVAAMLWSRVTGLDGFDNRGYFNYLQTYDEALAKFGYNYSVTQSAELRRPTLVRSPWLYLILSIQPLLTIVIIVGATFLYSTPVDRGFGLISILAGVNVNDLFLLQGAGLSGELKKKVNLNINAQGSESRGDQVVYGLGTHQRPATGRIKKGVKYS